MKIILTNNKELKTYHERFTYFIYMFVAKICLYKLNERYDQIDIYAVNFELCEYFTSL